MTAPLTIYNASAGSGKTFTLALEYITLLIQRPDNFMRTLAVTFTNKATEEMKIRILSNLHGLSRGYSDADAYLKHLMQRTGLSEAQVRERARQSLDLMMQNYSYFRVETIDAFFQTVLRNLARELELSATMRIDLNQNHQAESEAVDTMIERLSESDDIYSSLMSYIRNNIDDNKSWNVVSALKEFGRHIFDDRYIESREALTADIEASGDNQPYSKKHKIYFDELIKCCREMEKILSKFLQGQYAEFEKVLADNGYSTADLKQGQRAGATTYLRNLSQGKTKDADLKGSDGKRLEKLQDVDNWVNKPKKNEVARSEVLKELIRTTLLPMINETEKQRIQYNTVVQTRRHLHELSLLAFIDAQVREKNKEENRFQLSDTQHLIHRMIGDDPAVIPFLYEKIGARLHHIMIDEFQDTSDVQWRNFSVLLEHCTSLPDSHSLVVGDVKQSIYRWRNGDWRLLSGLGAALPQSDQKTLGTNWRSKRRIVEFNNAFFMSAIDHEMEMLRNEGVENSSLEAFANAFKYGTSTPSADQVAQGMAIEQRVKPGSKDEGMVRAFIFEKSTQPEDIYHYISDIISELMNEGAKMSDIAILVRNNKEIPPIAEWFSKHKPGVPIVSELAFRLDSSSVVCMLVSALRLLTHPEDELTRATLILQYHSILGDGRDINSLLHSQWKDDASLLPAELSTDRQRLLTLPLPDLLSELQRLLQTERRSDQSAFISTFLDQVSSYCANYGSDIEQLLSYWEERMHQITISSDAPEGVRILTIHKSKGLEYDHVIMPDCGWKMEKTNGTDIWCKPKVGLRNLPIVSIAYSGALKDTEYRNDYMEEHMQLTADNLNLLYVAFTRARSTLTIIARKGDKGTRLPLITDLLPTMAAGIGQLREKEHLSLPEIEETAKAADATAAGGGDHAEEAGASNLPEPLYTFRYGQWNGKERKTSEQTENRLLMSEESEGVEYHTYRQAATFMQSRESRQFVEEEDDSDDDSQKQRMDYLRRGNIVHSIFSRIRTLADLPRERQRMENEGLLYGDVISNEQLSQWLDQLSSHPQVREWFSPQWQVITERSILTRNKRDGQIETRRPDRIITDGTKTIVIDYKTGSHHSAFHEEHKAQVRNYMEYLKEMHYPEVEGYLWYMKSGKVVKV